MIAVSQAFRDAVRLGKPQRAVLKFEDATFTNEDISMTSGGITFYERFNESTDLTVGVAPSSGIRVTMINRDGKLNDFKFGKFTAAIGACVEEKTYTRDDVNGKTLVPVAGKPYKISYESDTVTEWWGNWTKRVYELVKLGTFIAPRPAVIRKYVVTVEADDQMTLFDEMWAKDLPVQYPVTLGGLLSAICKEAGVTLKSTSFLNSDMTVEEEPEDFENATVREVVAWIAEAACGYARFDRDGLLEIVWFNPTTQQYDEHDYTDFTPYSYQVQPVQQLNIRNQNSNAEAILGEGENAYMIQDNPFLRQDDGTEAETITGEPVRIMQVPGSASDLPSPIAAESGIKSISGNADRADSEPAPIAAESGITPIYNRLAGFAPFNPSSVDLLTDWSVQAGDMVNVASGADTYSLPVYSMTMNWNGSPKITLESSGNETRDPLPKFERQLFSAGHGGYGNALAVQDLKNWAEITIDEEHALIVEQAGRLDEQGNKIVTVERRIDGIDETITDMAGDIDENGKLIEGARQEIDGIHETITQQAGKLNEQGELISGAQRQIDGINKSIEDIAGDIDQITGDLSGVRTDLDGANKKITEQAGLISAQGELIEGVELELNGGEGYIGLKARMDGAESNIRIASNAIEAEVGRATKAEDDLSSRVKITEDNITEQSGKIDAQGKLIEGAQTTIDGLNKSITDIAGDVDEITGTLTGVSQKLDGVEKKVTTQAGEISNQGELISGAQEKIDGINKDIEDIAGDIDQITGDLSGVRTDLDGANKKITEQAGQISNQGELIEGVELTLNGKEGEIGLIARMTGAETSIQQNKDAIALRAVKSDVDAQFQVQAGQISSKVSAGGIASAINQTAQSVLIQASKIDLKGYVTAEYLQAHYVEADEISSFVTGEIDLERINADSGSIMDLSCGTLLVGQIDMGAHYHEFTPNPDGTITIGGPSATAGSFKIADTQFYKDGVSAAANNVGVNADTWENLYNTVTKQFQVRAILSNHNPISYAFEGSPDDYAVTLNDPTWGSGSTNTSNSYYVRASNGKEQSGSVYLTTSGSWTNGHTRVYMRSGSSGGTIRAQIQVDLPATTSTWKVTSGTIASGTEVSFYLGGKNYTHRF